MNRVSVMMLRQWWLVIRNWERLTDVVFWPLIDILLWGLSVKWLTLNGNGNEAYFKVVLISVVIWRGIWQGCCEIAMNFLDECWSRNLMNLLASPLSYFEWVLASILISWIKLFFTFFVSILLVKLFYGVSFFDFGIIGIYSFIMMSFFGQILGFFVTGIILRSGIKAQSLAWTFPFMISPLICAYFPVSVLPVPFQYLAKLLPPSWIFEKLRGEFITGTSNPNWWIYSLILTLIYLVIGVLILKRSFDYLRDNGLDHLE